MHRRAQRADRTAEGKKIRTHPCAQGLDDYILVISVLRPMSMRYEFKPQRLTNVLQELIADMGIGRKLDETRALEMWTELAGQHINRHTTRTWVRNGRLHVAVSSSVWRHELHLQRSQWLKRLNEALGKEVISEIVFR